MGHKHHRCSVPWRVVVVVVGRGLHWHDGCVLVFHDEMLHVSMTALQSGRLHLADEAGLWTKMSMYWAWKALVLLLVLLETKLST